MKSLILQNKKNYPDLIVYQSSNSFGDQLLEFIYELKSGEKERYKIEFPELHWQEFSKNKKY